MQPPCTIFPKLSCGKWPAAVTLPGAGRWCREALTAPSITCSPGTAPADKAAPVSQPSLAQCAVTASSSRQRDSWCNHPTLPWKTSPLCQHRLSVPPSLLLWSLGMYHRCACSKPAEDQTPSSFEEIVVLSVRRGPCWDPLLAGCFLCLDTAGMAAELEHQDLVLTCLSCVQVEMPQ